MKAELQAKKSGFPFSKPSPFSSMTEMAGVQPKNYESPPQKVNYNE
ncbi:hypothetical protein J7L49_04990 [Candidatus Bathyarchaeota archaeon]|nr:hypothetical protein [Candidatus Bathyarchaeota archaeon]